MSETTMRLLILLLILLAMVIITAVGAYILLLKEKEKKNLKVEWKTGKDFLYSLYDALMSISVPSDKARAVVDAMERDMVTSLATKADLDGKHLLLKQGIAATRDSLRQEIAAVEERLTQKIDGTRDLLLKEMELLRSSMTIRLGSIQIVSLGLLFAALRLT